MRLAFKMLAGLGLGLAVFGAVCGTSLWYMLKIHRVHTALEVD
jgi:hypothetical protein